MTTSPPVDSADLLHTVAVLMPSTLPELLAALCRLALAAEASPWPAVQQAGRLLWASSREACAAQGVTPPARVEGALPVDHSPAALLALGCWLGEQLDHRALHSHRGLAAWAPAAWDLTWLLGKLEDACAPAVPAARDTLRESAGPTDPAPAPEEAA